MHSIPQGKIKTGNEVNHKYEIQRLQITLSYESFWVPCKRRSSVNSGAWLQRFDDVTRVAKTGTLRSAMRTKW